MAGLSAFLAASSGNAKGNAWMFLTGLIFVLVTGAVRNLGNSMHPVQLVFLRYAIALIFLAPVILCKIRNYRSRTRRYGLHTARGVLHAIGVILWFYAMAHIPVAEVMALGFTAPIFATIGAALFLGERLYLRRISAVIIGFAGTVVILRPGVEVIELGALVCRLPIYVQETDRDRTQRRDRRGDGDFCHPDPVATRLIRLALTNY